MDNCALMIIKPFSVGRGDGASILEDTLKPGTLSLVRFREWIICPTTFEALSNTGSKEDFYPPNMRRPCWICLFSPTNPNTHAFDDLSAIWDNAFKHLPVNLRTKYKNGAHPADTVVRITPKDRIELESLLLF